MPTAKMIEVIKVTESVYDDPLTVWCHYLEEKRSGTYTPVVLASKKVLRGRTVTAYCVCRIPQTPDDEAYILKIKSWAKKNRLADSGVETVPQRNLFVFEGRKMVHWKRGSK